MNASRSYRSSIKTSSVFSQSSLHRYADTSALVDDAEGMHQTGLPSGVLLGDLLVAEGEKATAVIHTSSI
ncbi:hypothetical protein IEQ34_015255 [Dendrobium chrysotoxum]|uniref:Uncharacterized protein n=1 Tax=Dendrobium chrysotoxum TaxID=161865 RepID=A0AAV7GIG8_DENCH|nr:hypothetical protein IEQ34_015255 [Dendrobium chrysotoxum]